jgi:monoterpene epsilon-lactone hydrolase
MPPDNRIERRRARSLRARLLHGAVRRALKLKPPGDAMTLARWARRAFGMPAHFGWFTPPWVQITPVEAPLRGEWVAPRSGVAADAPVVYYLHGGGYVSCSPVTHRAITTTLALDLGARVFALDYRLAPEHPFPAALEDAVAGYRWLLAQGIDPKRLVVAGDSAGGGLALSTLVALRDAGEPLPAAALLLSPWTDLAGTGDSVRLNAEACDAFRPEDVPRFASAYLGSVPPEDPRASPLYARLEGLPPLLIHVGTSEILYDDSSRLHARATAAGVRSELHAWEGVPHVWHALAWLLPEARTALREAAVWLTARLIEQEKR